MFLPDVLQLVWRTNGHAGAAERVAELRVLLLHEQTVSGGVRATFQKPTEHHFQAEQYTGDVRIELEARLKGVPCVCVKGGSE